MREPASVDYVLHRSAVIVADSDVASINTVDHTLCRKSQVLVLVSGTDVSCTLVLEVEKSVNGSEYFRSQSYTISRSQAFLIEHGGGHIRIRITALSGTSPSITIYLKRV